MGLLEPTIYGEQFHDFYVNCAENRWVNRNRVNDDIKMRKYNELCDWFVYFVWLPPASPVLWAANHLSRNHRRVAIAKGRNTKTGRPDRISSKYQTATIAWISLQMHRNLLCSLPSVRQSLNLNRNWISIKIFRIKCVAQAKVYRNHRRMIRMARAWWAMWPNAVWWFRYRKLSAPASRAYTNW